MKAVVVAIVVLSIFHLSLCEVGADSLGKAYFAATPPGAWTKFESSWGMPDGTAGNSIYTYIRASDRDGRVRIEVGTETLAGPGAGMTSRQIFIMAPEFDLARDYLNRMLYLEASAAQTDEGSATLMQDNIIEIMRESSGDMTNSVTFKGRTKMAGRECDHYAYSYKSGGRYVNVQEGEICLDETAPFGIVYQKGRVTDEAGEPISSFEQKLVDSGTGKSVSQVLLAVTEEAAAAAPEGPAPEALPPLTLAEAFQGEKIRLFMEVVEGSGGRRLDVTVLNQVEEPLNIFVPAGSLKISAGIPIGTLNLIVGEEQRFSLDPGGSSSSISVGQPGERGVTGGKFQLTVYEGDSIYQGSVEVGPLE